MPFIFFLLCAPIHINDEHISEAQELGIVDVNAPAVFGFQGTCIFIKGSRSQFVCWFIWLMLPP